MEFFSQGSFQGKEIVNGKVVHSTHIVERNDNGNITIEGEVDGKPLYHETRSESTLTPQKKKKQVSILPPSSHIKKKKGI